MTCYISGLWQTARSSTVVDGISEHVRVSLHLLVFRIKTERMPLLCSRATSQQGLTTCPASPQQSTQCPQQQHKHCANNWNKWLSYSLKSVANGWSLTVLPGEQQRAENQPTFHPKEPPQGDPIQMKTLLYTRFRSIVLISRSLIIPGFKIHFQAARRSLSLLVQWNSYFVHLSWGWMFDTVDG